MGFIKVKKGKKIISIPRTTFERQFKDAGWVEVDSAETQSEHKEVKKDTTESSKNADVEPDTDSESDDDWDEAAAEVEAEEEDRLQELLEKPISDLTPEEVKIVASSKGIDIKGKNIKQIREVLKRTN